LLDVFLSVLWFFLWIAWIYLLVRVFADIFRSHDTSGGGKAGWSVLVLVLPFLGAFIYLIARGDKMARHEEADARAQEQQFRAYIRDAADGNGTAGDLAKPADLRGRGVISEAGFPQGKQKVLGKTAA
jgi:hypothetical protein